MADSLKSWLEGAKDLVLPHHMREWLRERALRREFDRVSTQFKKAAFREEAWLVYNRQAPAILEKLAHCRTQRLIQKAYAWDVAVPSEPVSNGEWQASEYWCRSDPSGPPCLTSAGQRQIRKLIQQEIRERFQLWSVPVTWVLAILGLLATVLNLLFNLLKR